MNNGARARRLVGVAGLILGVTVLTACPEDDPVDAVTAPGTGTEAIANFIISSGEGFGGPTGVVSHSAFSLAFAPAGETDVYARKIEGNGSFFTSTLFGCCGGWDLDGFDRNGSTDPRLPAIVDDDAAVEPGADNLVILDPSGLCGSPCPFHNPFGGPIENLEPDTAYIVALFRYGLQVNGELDAQEVLLGSAVADPDELVVLGGSGPFGDPTVELVFPTFAPMTADANPLILGRFTTDALGAGSFDVIVNGPGFLYEDLSGSPPEATFDSTLVARNDGMATGLPRYNYMVILEGPATDAADAADNPQVLRWQLGQDLDAATGEPMPDAFAPFPTSPLTASELEAINGVVHPRASTATVSQLKPLSGSFAYRVWLMNLLTGSSAPAVGTITETTESGDVTTPNTSAFNPESDASIITIQYSAASTGVSLSDYSHVALTYESSADGTTPSDRRFLFLQYINRNGTDGDFSDDAAAAGSMWVGVPAANDNGFSRSWGFAGEGLAHFLGDAFRAQVENIPRPPVGFAYHGWLVASDADGDEIIHGLGPLTVDNPPTYTPLLEADVSRDIPDAGNSVVAPTFIAEAINWNLVADVTGLQSFAGEHPFCNVSAYWVTLEPKQGNDLSGPGPTVAVNGATPETFLTSALCQRTTE